MGVRRLYVEKKKGFDVEAQGMLEDIRISLGIKNLLGLRIINRYDIEGLTAEEYEKSCSIVFSEPPVDIIYESETFSLKSDERVFAIEYLPGQYDQRADAAAQCVQVITQRERPLISVAKLIVLRGSITENEYKAIKDYCINPIESREASLDLPDTLTVEYPIPEDIEVLDGFIDLDKQALEGLMDKSGFAMTFEDLLFCQRYFHEEEKRDPTITEIRVIDTYWSDHCRHTTFSTEITDVEFEEGPFRELFTSAYKTYKKNRKEVYADKSKPECLMDIATIAMKALKRQGYLDDLDESDEINACSIVVKADVDGELQDWLVMFKNETHNHPTEIEPFGGAATCLGGAIRDPLSGRSYVYQAMRVTGSGDPRTSFEDTIPGKLMQKKITTGAAAGYSSYGNQIGVATGQVSEIYHDGYVAKRMELGAVVGAAPRSNVVREKPAPGDVIILLGGRTGRDGCGGATGSSKAHTEESLTSCGAEVQKGNPPTERNIQRLFRDPLVTRMIKKCNDFGAGGVSVAIGELAPGLKINLDAVPKKYEGLDGTELAISESQERMAVVISPGDVQEFIEAASKENLEATVVAEVTEEKRLVMLWRGSKIVDLDRKFMDTNGAKQFTKVLVTSPSENDYFNTSLSRQGINDESDIREKWLKNLQDLNVCSQRGLVELFDSTIGAGTVLMPLGGKYQLTPAEGMAAKLPVLEGETNTSTLMAYGCNPYILSWSPFHGAVYAITEAIAKITAMGGDYRKVRLSLQEYFERLESEPGKWGKPFAALLGALYIQLGLKIPAIGGKDSMSGTFKDISVPPTLAAFAICTADAKQIISSEFKKVDSRVVLVSIERDENLLPDLDSLSKSYTAIYNAIQGGKVISAHSIRYGGLAEAITKMAFGNKIGFVFHGLMDSKELFEPAYGNIIVELNQDANVEEIFKNLSYKVLGKTQENASIEVNGVNINLEDALTAWEEPLESTFPTKAIANNEPDEMCKKANAVIEQVIEKDKTRAKSTTFKYIKMSKGPRVFIPVFPGTNCEDDTTRAFEKAGGIPDVMVIRNQTPEDIDESLKEMAKRIANSQIIMIPGGFSGGDEPDGSGRFIAAAFRNHRVRDSVMDLLNERDGLILGICNGFQALIKLGLVPYGEIRDLECNSPTLTYNTIGRHVSRMVRTRVSSILSPWFSYSNVGDIHTIPVSHGEGRFVADQEFLERLAANGQIATQYVDMDGNPGMSDEINPNGSLCAVEGITSPDGRVFGKMGHSERVGSYVAKNVPGNKEQMLFKSGVEYFK